MAVLSYQDAFTRFATDSAFKSRIISGFRVWILSKLADVSVIPPYRGYYIDLYGKVIRAEVSITDPLFVKLFQAIAHEASYWEDPITDLQIFNGFEFVVFPILFAYGYVSEPVAPV